jgi:hypothetical protein
LPRPSSAFDASVEGDGSFPKADIIRLGIILREVGRRAAARRISTARQAPFVVQIESPKLRDQRCGFD